jgi:ribosome biogenesis GTPase
LRAYAGKCRFAGCRHGAEPDCAVKQAVAQGRIDGRRFELFNRIVAAEAAARAQAGDDAGGAPMLRRARAPRR